MVDTRTHLTISQGSNIQKIRVVSKARTLAEKSVQLSAIAQAIEQQQNATDEIIELFWVSSGTNRDLDDVLDVFVRAPMPQHCQPLEPTSAMSSIMTRWSTSCFTILWRKGVYIPEEWSTSFSKQAIPGNCKPLHIKRFCAKSSRSTAKGSSCRCNKLETNRQISGPPAAGSQGHSRASRH